ncbi:Structure-specific endonuclease subunit SLX4 [Varanus komodoensis]|nr:Structure-specific endonuclease subunit SLX4 [Varanus komodoensis]
MPACQTPPVRSFFLLQGSALSACLSHSGHVRSPQFDHVIAETEPFRDRVCGDLLGSLGEPKEKLACSQNDAAALEDLMELASEGLTLTQWGLEAQQLQGAEQELVLGKAPESRLVQCLEKRPPPRSCHQEVPLGLLAAAFRGMVNNPHLSDVQFQVDSGELFYAHAFVLYARCPQLLEMVDSQGFTVAEDGGAATCRVLLREARAEAVQAFLNYLYAADHAIPHCLLPDVAALAARFGVRELAALCHGQSGLALTAGEEEEEDTTEEKDRAETFEELLRSMWQDEEDGALSNGIHPDNANSTRDLVSEPELEEIYGFAVTQRAAVPGGTGQRQGASQPVPGESCPRTGLEKATPTGSRRECKGGRTRDAPGDASGEGMRRRLPLAAWTNAKEGRSLGAAARLSPAEVVLGLAEVSEKDDCPALPESLASVTLEGSPGSPGAGERRAGPALQDTPTGHPPSPLQGSPEGSQRALGMLSRNPHAPVLPLGSSPLLSPPSPPSHTCSLHASASQLPSTGRRSSVEASEQEGAERSDGVLGSSAERPLYRPRSLGHLEANLIVVLDSDEEVEPKEEVCPGLDGLRLGACKRRRGSGVGCSGKQGLSPLPLQGMGAPGLAVPVGDEAGSPQAQSSGLWGWSSSPEEDTCSKGGMLLVPDTPPLSRERAVPSSRPQSKAQWLRFLQERPPAQSSPPLRNRPFPPRSATRWPGCSPSWPPPEVVVLDDSEEEQEAALPCPAGTAVSGAGLPSWEEVVGGFLPFVELAGARSSLGGALQMSRRKTEGHPWVVGPAAAGGAASSGSGVATSVERTPCQQEWAEDLNSSQAARPAARKLPALEPAGEAACDLACWTPLTPSYSIMETPKLKKELRRFGVRPLPKRQMVLKLKEIFRYTHSKVGADCTAQAVSPQPPRSHNPSTTESRTEASSTHQKQLPRFQQMFPGSNSDPSGGGGDQRSGHVVEPSGAGSGQPKSPDLPAAAFAVRDSCRLSPMASQESTGSSVTDSEASVTSQSSSSTGFESSSLVLAEQEHLPVSQAAACETLKLAALQCYLRSKPAFLRQILMYQPIELAVLQAELKQNGIGIALGKLLDFLDALCITFTTAEARREKQHRHGTKRKGRQRC